MTTEDDIASLLAKVKAATGPDREIDRALAKMAGWREIQFTAPDINGSTNRLSVWMPDSADDGTIREYVEDIRSEVAANIWRDRGDVPEYTASIDAALALVERLTPGWRIALYQMAGHWQANIAEVDAETDLVLDDHFADAQTAPLAILCALLTSLKENHP